MQTIIDTKLDIPKGLNEINIPEDCAERIAQKAMQDCVACDG